MTLPRRSLLAALLGSGASAAGLAACTPKAAPQDPATSTTSPAAPTTGPQTPQRPIEPLTGRSLTNAKALNHPAVAIKISDVPESQPEINLDKADIVFCEPNGVSYTRLAAVFHSRLPADVGPVRSIRPADAALLSPLTPVFANTSAATWVLNYIEKMGRLDNLSTLKPQIWKRGAYTIDPRRVAPNHVIAHPATLLAMSHLREPPRPYFAYAASAGSAATASGTKATSVSIPYGPGFAIGYAYSPSTKRYLRSQPWGKHVLANGKQVSVDTVVILRVSYTMGRLPEYGGGGPVPLLALEHGSGALTVLNRGRVVRGTWTKGALTDPFTFTTKDGKPLELAPGTTWVELPTPQAKVVVR